MGKGNRTKARRTQARHRIVVVDGLEVGAAYGMLTLRAGRVREQAVPACLVLYPELALELMRGLQPAVLDAEEVYWTVIGPLVDQVADPTDQAAVADHLQRWLLDQDWASLVAAAPGAGADAGPLLLTHAGHVALAVNPPYVTRPTVLIFDPQQLHRTRTKFQAAVAKAQQTAPAAPDSLVESLAYVHRFLAGKPWPPGGFPTVTTDQAGAEMRRRLSEFLSRSPFIRPASNDLAEAIKDDAPDSA